MADVGCAGILVADMFCGPMKELPREGELLAVDDMPAHAGGCAANVAIDLAKQGVSVDVAGCVGHDPSANIVTMEMKENRVGCDHVAQAPNLPTSKTVILLVHGQDRRYIHTFGANAAFTVDHIQRDWVAGLKVFYLGGLFLMPSFRTLEFLDLLKFCREQGVVTVVDVVIPQHVKGMADLAPLLPYIDYFLPNDDEAQALTGCKQPTDQLKVFLAAGAGTVIVTCGREGSLAAGKGECWRSGIFPMQVVDPSGSGDAFDAGIITGILREWDLPKMVQYASALGASAVRSLGTTQGVFSASEAEAFLAANHLETKHERLD
jgi:sugar/nucleoside kinase (ribokinase family)